MAGRRPAKRVICFFISVILFYVIVLTNHRMFGTLLNRVVEITWRENDMTFNEEPPLTNSFVINYKDVDVTAYFVKIKEHNIYCLESRAIPLSAIRNHVVLLHDSVFSATAWKEYGTLQLLATWGYRALAVDLPGYGRSSKEAVLSKNKLSFFFELMNKLNVQNIVLVAPSIGGLFADPYINKHQSQIAGIITISSILPSQTKINKNKKLLDVPMLVIYGDKDKATEEKTSILLSHSKKVWVKQLPDTGLKILDERASDFHKILFNFLEYLQRHSSSNAISS